MSNTSRPRLLGIAASLRNARWGAGNQALIASLEKIGSREELLEFLTSQSSLHLENFVQAGRKEGKDFLEIYRNLRRNRGDVGLSNSEVALAAALWSAKDRGLAIEHLSLAEHFGPGGELRDEGSLREALQRADGILVSGPVYFGDRGSLAESLFEYMARDRELRQSLAGKLYGGIAVGAKRNGGQETTLIYQLLDALQLGLLGVGNDSDTTAQYGGTGLAGDVGTMASDEYGLNTSMGTGRRMARVMHRLRPTRRLEGPPRVLFLLLAEADGLGMRAIERLVAQNGNAIDATVADVSGQRIRRCLACDICPTRIDVDEKYRCIIESRNDDLAEMHHTLLHHDMIVPVAVSLRDRERVESNYQVFIERTRYLRRGDYVLTDQLVTPLLIEELGCESTFVSRMVTSFIRHHTVMSRPVTGYLSGDRLLNEKDLDEAFGNALLQARRITAGRLESAVDDGPTKYNPVGYVLSTSKDIEDERMQRRQKMVEERRDRLGRDAEERLER